MIDTVAPALCALTKLAVKVVDVILVTVTFSAALEKASTWRTEPFTIFAMEAGVTVSVPLGTAWGIVVAGKST